MPPFSELFKSSNLPTKSGIESKWSAAANPPPQIGLDVIEKSQPPGEGMGGFLGNLYVSGES